MRVAFIFCEHAMAARFAKLSEDELSCLLEEKYVSDKTNIKLGSKFNIL